MKRIINWIRIGICLYNKVISNAQVEALFPIELDIVPKACHSVIAEFAYVDSVVIDSQKNMNLLEFFRSKQGLYSFEGFMHNVLRYVTGNLFQNKQICVDYFDLRENLWDREIRAKVPPGYTFDLVEGLICIALFVYKQWQNKASGVLRTNSGAINVFYLDVFGTTRVIGVRWIGGYDGWGIDSWEPDAKIPEFAGFRVFIKTEAQ